MPTKSHKRTTGEVIRDFAFYVAKIAVCLALFAGLSLFVIYDVPKKYWIGERWVGLILFTLGIFGFGLYRCKPLWRRPLFWVSIAALLLLHTAFWNFALRRMETFEAPWFAFAAAPELAVLAYVLGWIDSATKKFKHLPRRHGRA